jgi:hypothetical protein
MGFTLYWRVIAPGNSDIITQTRQFDILRIAVPASRAGWTAECRNGNHPWDQYGGEPDRIFDDDLNTGWHSKTGTALPQCLVVDMKNSMSVLAVSLAHLPEGLANGWIYFKTIEIYLSETSVVPDIYQSSWGEPAVKYTWPGGIDPSTINLPALAKGRYMILYFPDSRTSTYISFAELNVYILN